MTELFPYLENREDLRAAAPGFAMMVRDGKQCYSYATGVEDEPQSPEVSVDTVYDIASVSKIFTTALVLRTHEAGRLSVEDDVAKYLPNFANSKMSLIDLLAHRADFNLFLSHYRKEYSEAAELKNALLDVTPPSEGSEGIYYGNINLIYLGEILERVNNASLDSQMHNLFTELGLANTYTGIDVANGVISAPATELIDGQIYRGAVHDETALQLGGLAGNAGIFSSARDLVQFGQQWLDGGIVAPDLAEKALVTNYDRSGVSPQGLGWWLRKRTQQGEIPTPELASSTGFTGPMLAINTRLRRVGALTCNRTFYGRDNMQDRLLWSELADALARP